MTGLPGPRISVSFCASSWTVAQGRVVPVTNVGWLSAVNSLGTSLPGSVSSKSSISKLSRTQSEASRIPLNTSPTSGTSTAKAVLLPKSPRNEVNWPSKLTNWPASMLLKLPKSNRPSGRSTLSVLGSLISGQLIARVVSALGTIPKNGALMGRLSVAEPVRSISISEAGSLSPAMISAIVTLSLAAGPTPGSVNATVTAALIVAFPSTTSIPRKPKRAAASIFAAETSIEAVKLVSLKKSHSVGLSPSRIACRSIPSVTSARSVASIAPTVLKSKSARPDSRSKPMSNVSLRENSFENSKVNNTDLVVRS